MLDDQEVPFSVREPKTPTPLVVEVPHAGLFVDAMTLSTLVAPAIALGRDADLYVDELVQDAPDFGAALLVAHVSRYVIDLNRAETDLDTLAVEGTNRRSSPHGLIWRTTTDGRAALSAPLTQVELERRLESYYRPYHRKLRALLDERVERFGYAVLLCAHSMPSRGRDGHQDAGKDRADIVPGSRGRTSAAPAVIDAVDRLARESGFSVAHDQPYRGGYSTGHYGRPERRVHAVQIELSRRLYMDELTLARKMPDFDRVRGFARALVERLVSVEVPASART
ncbi:MAG TPA: N-formylglutamate amidohydrolase [Polyangiaceae bacterium]